MPLLFDWYETPDSHDKPYEERVLYPRVCLRPRCSTEDLCRQIENMTTAHRADIALVLSALSHVLGEQLKNGCQVHIDGLGYFNVTLTTSEPVYHSTRYKKLKVRIGGIQFLPEKELKETVRFADATRMEEAPHSAKLTNEEMESRLTAHFAGQQFLTRREFQSLCHLTRTTAGRYLHQLSSEGKLLNRGNYRCPIYVPAPGCFGTPAASGTEPETTEEA